MSGAITHDPLSLCQTIAGQVWGRPIAWIMGRTREVASVDARHVVMVALVDQYGLSSPEVGMLMGCTASAVRHAKRRVRSLAEVDKAFAHKVREFLEMLSSARRALQ